ncbi:DUF6562 domain-containing protein [Bacteroides sp. ET336]|uniref:DUF6562 domain-containing protein n=1 Tax=Bacteroides sp. ET336 TaxID=2972459 RepID=UPI0021AC7B19|nr:DUF6562 domain-containing protein [Bacteroides sp. ET336]MCR8893829.1 hypothetical protein [Bacteroides sp. ET336]MDN0058326.1 hypothetical protein [Bacteroides caecigallinarum]
MKKLTFLLVSGLLILFSACQKVGGIDSVSDSVSVNVKADVPSGVSRVPGDGMTVNRCVLQVYKVVDGQTMTAYGELKYSAMLDREANFELNLPKNTDFRFVLWADYVDDPVNAISTDKHYALAQGLANVSFSNDYTGSDETRDAFYGVADLTDEETIGVTLTRPFAQLSIYSSDLQTAVPQPVKVKITSDDNNLVTGFNACTGELSTSDAKFSYEASILAGGNENQMTLDYLFAPTDEAQLINFNVEFFDADDISLSTKDLSNIPLQKNYATKITGNFFSSVPEVEITVAATVNAGFDGEKNQNY